MDLAERITLMVQLGKYLLEPAGDLEAVKEQAFQKNKWFTKEFVDLSISNIAHHFLEEEKLRNWVQHYHLDDNIDARKIGIVMAGNIPLVGFHDFLAAFITGHRQMIKLSEKDDVLLPHLMDKIKQWNQKASSLMATSDRLKDCDAYIATGSNNASRYFHQYFGKYPSIIRSNKTSVAVLSGGESADQLARLADDVYTYFGLGCRNVTKLFVPAGYHFEGLLRAFEKYNYFSEITKYRNNYDYHLALLIMNSRYYMTNGSILLSESEDLFSPVSALHYSFYTDKQAVYDQLESDTNIQGIVSGDFIPFGCSQEPGLFDYADGIDTLAFLLSL